LQVSARPGIAAWRTLADSCTDTGLDTIQTGLAQRISSECDYIDEHWPINLPTSAIHADLFPDNVLMLDSEVTGLIDFYFACTDIRGYDLAVTHAAWCFNDDGSVFDRALSAALLGGYASAFTLDVPTRDAFPILLRGVCLRFLLTRCYDWINTPANALVTRKSPWAFLKRLDFYCDNNTIEAIMGQLQ
jgi:homoserine kinase type II